MFLIVREVVEICYHRLLVYIVLRKMADFAIESWLLIKTFLPVWKPVNFFWHVFVGKASNHIMLKTSLK